MPFQKKAAVAKKAEDIMVRQAHHSESVKIINKPSGPSAWTLTAKLMLVLGALLIPLAAGTWTPDRWEIHKTLVLLVVITIAWFCFFVDQFRRPVSAWKWMSLDWLVIAFGLAAVIGTVFSVDWWTSLVGLQGAASETLPVVLGFISIYFLSARLFYTPKDRMMVWSALLAGIGLSLFMQLFQMAGGSFLTGSIAKDALFSTLANSSLQVSLMAAAFATVGLLLWPKAKERWAQWSVVAIVAIGWLTLLFMAQAIAWAAFALGMILVVVSQASRGTASSKLVIAAVMLAAAGMLGQFLNVAKYANVPSTAELSLRQSISATTSFNTIAKRPVLGSGPSTWFNAFVQYRPLSYNSDTRWSSRFIRSGAEWSQMLATTGVVGLAVWIGILVMAGWTFWRHVRRGYSFTMLVGLFTVALLALSGALTTYSFILLAFGWYALGLGRAKIAESETVTGSTPMYVPALGFALTVILAVVVWYPAVKVYASQVILEKAQNQMTAKAKNATIISTLKRAVQFDSKNLDASILLANAYGMKIQDDITANDITTAQQDLQLSTTTIRTAVLKNPNNPVSYEAENNILNGLASYLPNPETQANANFVALKKLEPSNPIHDVGYGQTLQVVRARAAANTTAPATQAQLDDYQTKILAAFNEALRKKPDYLQAQFARADANMSNGKYQDALNDLDALVKSSPTIATFWSAQGTALAKLNKLDMATASFEQALKLDASDPSIYLAYSQALSDAKKIPEAKDVLNKGIKALPTNTDLPAALKKLPA